MKRHVHYLIILGIYSFFSLSLRAQESVSLLQTDPATPQSPIRFIPNQGQWKPQAQFKLDIPGGHLFLEKQGLSYVFLDQEKISAAHASAKESSKAQLDPNTLRAHSLKVRFLNSREKVNIQASQASSTRYNYFLGEDEKKWAKDLPAYSKIVYSGLYPGINLSFKSGDHHLKYEFELIPYASPEKIALEYSGADNIRLENGNLRIQTSLGEILEKKPYSYQVINGKKQEVPSQFHLDGNVLSFEFPEGYDPSHSLIIDPDLLFASYSGSVADNWGSTATFDLEGNLYSGGVVFGTGFPVTSGAFNLNFGGAVDMGILKFSPDGTELLYATYLGGNDGEFPHSLIVDNAGDLLILGSSSSQNYPVSANAFQRSFGGGTNVTPISGIVYNSGSDIVISKLNSSGDQLLASTYLGGSANDGINVNTGLGFSNYGDVFRGEIIMDEDNNVYLSSTTFSSNYPLQNAFQAFPGGLGDGVISKLNPDLSNLLWSSYLGGSSFDAAYSIKINPINGDVYTCGGTQSSNLRSIVPSTAGTPHLGFAQGGDDGFIAQISSDGQMQQITYLGTSNNDQAFLMDFDEEGNPHVIGQTLGLYPVTALYSNPNSGQFIDKLSPDLGSSLISTVIGTGKGSPDINLTAMLINECGNIYLSGWGSPLSPGLSTNGLAVTPDAFQSTTDGQDFYILILEKDAQSLVYATFFGEVGGGGEHVDGGTSRFSKDGVIYHAVCASCGGTQGFPVSPGVVSGVNNSSNCNNGVFKFDIGRLSANFDIFDASIGTLISQACEFPLQVQFNANTLGANAWSWKIDGVDAGNTQSIVWDFTRNDVYEIELTASNPVSCLKEVVVIKQFPVSQVELDDDFQETICAGDAIPLNTALNSSNPFTFEWTPTAGLDDPNSLNPIASPNQSTTYTLSVRDDNNCIAEKEYVVEVIPPLPLEFGVVGVIDNRACFPAEITYTYTPPDIDNPTWTWEIEGFGTFTDQTSVTVIYQNTGVYSVRLSAGRLGQCPDNVVIERDIEILPSLELALSPDAAICFGESTQLSATATPGVSYSWSPSTGLSNPQIANPIANPTESTVYTLKITNAAGCEKEEEVLVEVSPEITLDFEIDLGSDCAQPTLLNFINNSEGAANYVWELSNGAVFSAESPEAYTFTQGGNYQVTLRGFNGVCEESQSIDILVEDNLSPPPNAITPGNDSNNETFKISAIRPNYKLEVYNRWGGLIYESEDYQDEWGSEADAGVYYYILTSPAGVKCRGWLDVIR